MTWFLVMMSWIWGGLQAQPSLSAQVADTPFETLTQADLNVITGNVQRPNGMVWFNDKLYVVCTGDWTIYEIDSRTGDTRTYVYGIRNGHMLVAETNEQDTLSLWVPDFDTERLLNIVSVRAPANVTEAMGRPWGIIPIEDDFLVTSLGDDTVMRVTREGEMTTLAEGLRSPTGIAMDDERVYVANSGSSRRSIEWFDRSALEAGDTLTASPLVQGLQNASGLVFAPDGYLYFAYALGSRGVVGRVDPTVCAEAGGCDNDQIEVVLYTDLSAPLAGLTISDDMRLFIHTMFRPEIYWVQLPAVEVESTEE
jgi:glucose/arabinose dehydrogenase